MRIGKILWGPALLATAVLSMTSSAYAVIDNSVSGTPVCSSCDVGEGLGFSRTVEGSTSDDTTYTDDYAFTLNEAATITGTVSANNTESPFFNQNVTLALIFDPAGAATPVIGSPNPITLPNTNGIEVFQAFLFSNLAAGDYAFEISGLIAQGLQGGQYEVQSVISAVPLPPAIWLFLSALVGLVSFARVRRRNGASA
jgi:hypothetical protein